MAATFTLVNCIRGYHVYKNVWEPGFGDSVCCQCEDRNPQDPYAVAVKKDDTTFGHVPRTILCICMLFLKREGTINAIVTCPRQYSHDLPHAGRSRVALHVQIYWRKVFSKESASSAAQ